MAFSDESWLLLSSIVNEQNCRMKGSERLQQQHQTVSNSPSVSVWGTLSQREIFAPYLFENQTVTAESYNQVLC